MDEIQNEENLDSLNQEDEAKEVEALKETKDFRKEAAEFLGVDKEDEEYKDLLDKMEAKEKANHAKLKSILEQKINYRKKFEEATKKATEKPIIPPKEEKVVIPEDLIDKKIQEFEKKRELSSLKLPEEVKKEVEDYVAFKNCSVSEAMEVGYIKSRIEEFNKAKRVEEAANSFSNNSFSTKDFQSLNLGKDFDVKTKDGREKFDKFLKEYEKKVLSGEIEFLPNKL